MRRFISKTRVHLWLLVALALAGGSRGAGQVPAQPQARPVFPSGVELVTVDVVVLDRQGRPVDGLTRGDFTVKENGRQQTIAAFEAVSLEESAATPTGRQRVSTNAAPPESAGRWFFVVFDDANVSQFSTPRAREVIGQFLERALRPGDRVLVAPTSGGAWWTGGVPEDRDGLGTFVSHLQGARRPETGPGRIWDYEAMAIALGRDRQAQAQVARRYFEANLIPEAYPQDRELSRELDVSPGIALIQAKARETYREAAVRLDAALNTIDRIATALAQVRGRKTLLLVSEGFIMDPSRTEFRTVLQSARNANVAVYFVDVRSPEGMLGQPGMAGGGAEFGAAIEERDTTTALAFAARETEGAYSVAIDTGGRAVAGVKTVDELVKVAAESRTYYLLGYTPPTPGATGSSGRSRWRSAGPTWRSERAAGTTPHRRRKLQPSAPTRWTRPCARRSTRRSAPPASLFASPATCSERRSRAGCR
jgi:VWFA-related protein